MRWSGMLRGDNRYFKRKKVTVVGSGNVGATAAFLAAQKELADIVLLDVVEGVPQGKALDMFEASPIQGYNANVFGTNDYADTAGSDLVIITAGIARKPGMSRDDLLSTNVKIVAEVTKNIVQHSPNCILLVVTNPLDAMVYTAMKVSGFPRSRVIGMAGVLDSARMRSFIAEALEVSIHDVTAFVLGGHGDTMVPLARYSTVAGIPITELMDADQLSAITERTAQGGAEIVKLLKTGSAFYAPGAAVVEMAEAILKDQKRILPCAALLEGEYGVDGYFLGVPCKLGGGGMEGVIELDLSDDEMAALMRSLDAVKGLVADVDAMAHF
ncbi:MAG: malate dehydrogenase [Zetaproteobacteria bacterium CG12_big_fil_rev_8_21_14_0_65_55_1124]|nr:MAG: malate dehydrogenase [Zetaproteobacteria bacterium CG08_land_8_20_14_0_20_55_17]PIW43017.1 MAG: malate dehydrogenase [Zetaproteobacteria bacterium CG12_big_fil_rev_8_21_14_0_65_55_1124]PIY52886.1 MAG: malate dehydrogenase [Zetaproteobacteria bacterium CG_4_10_14_0_8_um_filter_55_43]PIZ38285.1 MAG: malate dehydrogenase [Zetaproteobacteria bacterium CG_4_10_14_0_2_um_filter_55_20]PJB82218.1 MAG: malate dehydrogenase [Zetaproteobacteria bacterium CG_4_9_14_0_8_um_filter_55_31]